MSCSQLPQIITSSFSVNMSCVFSVVLSITEMADVKQETAESANIESLELFTADTVLALSDGFLSVLEPELVHVQKSLSELM